MNELIRDTITPFFDKVLRKIDHLEDRIEIINNKIDHLDKLISTSSNNTLSCNTLSSNITTTSGSISIQH